MWNVATDLAINSFIADELPEGGCIPGKGLEDYLEWLSGTSKLQNDDQFKPEDNDGEGQGRGSGDGDGEAGDGQGGVYLIVWMTTQAGVTLTKRHALWPRNAQGCSP